MSKYHSKMYAKALAELLSDKKGSLEMKKNIAHFIAFLEKNRDMKKTKEIIPLAESLWYKKTGKRKITLESARKIEKKNVLKDFFQEGDMVTEKINPGLIAGIKVVVNNEKQLDFSLKNKLDNIFN